MGKSKLLDRLYNSQQKKKPVVEEVKDVVVEKVVEEVEIECFDISDEVFEIKQMSWEKKLITSIQKIERMGERLTAKDIARLMAYNICELGQFAELMGWKSMASVNQFLDRVTIIQPFSSKNRKGHKFIIFDEKALALLKQKSNYK